MRLGWVPATAGIAWLDLSAKTLQGGGVLLSLKEAPLDPGQDLFAKVFRACPDGITISSMEDGTYLEVNEVMLNQMGMSRDQVVGHSSLELDVWVNPEDRLRYLEELSRTGSVRNFETRFRTRAGRILPFEVSSEIIQVQGKPYSFNFMRDLTTARELVKGRQESEAKFRLLFEQAPLGMAVVETETGHFRSVNHRLGTIIGCEAASLIGRSFQEFTHPDDLAADVRSVQDLAIGNVKEVEKEKRYINGLGKVVWGRLKMVKLPPAPDGTARHLSLVEDITAHKVLGLRLSKSNLPDLSKSEARQGGF